MFILLPEKLSKTEFLSIENLTAEEMQICTPNRRAIGDILIWFENLIIYGCPKAWHATPVLIILYDTGITATSQSPC